MLSPDDLVDLRSNDRLLESIMNSPLKAEMKAGDRTSTLTDIALLNDLKSGKKSRQEANTITFRLHNCTGNTRQTISWRMATLRQSPKEAE